MDIILEDNQIIEQIKKPEKHNQKESPSLLASSNFEHLFSEIIEAQSDIESLDDGVQKFFSQYIENITNPNEIKNTVKILKQNKSFQEKIYDIFKLFLEEDLKENKEKAENGIKITKQIETKTYQVARAKDMFRELNDMIHSDIFSHQKKIKKLSNEIKNMQQQILDYDKEIEILNVENKKTYSEELNLLDTVMTFGKKLYTTYATREEKKKEKNKIESELIKLKEEKKDNEMKYKEALGNIIKKEEAIQIEFQEQKKEIELFLNLLPSTNSDYNDILNPQKSFYSSKLKKYNTLKKTQKEKNIKDIDISVNELKEHIDCCDNEIIQELFTHIEIIRNIHPYLSFPPNIDINNLVDTVESLNNQISFLINEETPQEKINIEREIKMEEIGTKIADLYYDKFIKHLFIDSLKLNYEEEKKKKEAEQKMKELKDKEEKLKQLQIKYINEQGSISSENSQISNSSINSTNNEIANNDNNKKKYLPSQKNTNITSSSSSISNNNSNNTINIKINDKKKEEKKKNKMPNINVIIEEDDSKSKTKNNKNIVEKKDNKIEKEKEKEKENETTEKKNNNKQKSYKKRGKPSQNKKKKNKKNKKYDDDSLDKSYENISDIDNNMKDNENQHIFTQMLIKDNDGQKKDDEKRKEKQKKSDYYYESDNRKNKNLFNFPKNNFTENDENTGNDISGNFDLNDLNFLTELGEEVNKSEKNFAFGRKNNFRK